MIKENKELQKRIDFVEAMVEMINEDSMDITDEAEKFKKLVEILDRAVAELSDLFFIGKDKKQFDYLVIDAKKITDRNLLK